MCHVPIVFDSLFTASAGSARSSDRDNGDRTTLRRCDSETNEIETNLNFGPVSLSKIKIHLLGFCRPSKRVFVVQRTSYRVNPGDMNHVFRPSQRVFKHTMISQQPSQRFSSQKRPSFSIERPIPQVSRTPSLRVSKALCKKLAKFRLYFYQRISISRIDPVHGHI